MNNYANIWSYAQCSNKPVFWGFYLHYPSSVMALKAKVICSHRWIEASQLSFFCSWKKSNKGVRGTWRKRWSGSLDFWPFRAFSGRFGLQFILILHMMNCRIRWIWSLIWVQDSKERLWGLWESKCFTIQVLTNWGLKIEELSKML